MYKGYKSYRAYVNAKVHALSIIICGDRTVLDGELTRYGVKSVTHLSDAEAKEIYLRLIPLAKKANMIAMEAALIASGQQKITVKQRNKIIRLMAYKYNWKPESSFKYILRTLPGIEERLSDNQLKRNSLKSLYGVMRMDEADRVIKRLEQMEKKNLSEVSDE